MLPPTFCMVHLLHRLYGEDAPGADCAVDTGQVLVLLRFLVFRSSRVNKPLNDWLNTSLQLTGKINNTDLRLQSETRPAGSRPNQRFRDCVSSGKQHPVWQSVLRLHIRSLPFPVTSLPLVPGKYLPIPRISTHSRLGSSSSNVHHVQTQLRWSLVTADVSK